MKEKDVLKWIQLMKKEGVFYLKIKSAEFELEIDRSDKKTIDQSHNGVEKQDSDTVLIRSPMVGVFFDRSAPGSTPFVKVGSEVSEGDVVAMIESMKVMNELPTTISGRVTDIYIKNGEPVDFDQPIMNIQIKHDT